MKLNLRQIEVFRAIMLSGSISGASKLLFVSQPAVSRLIAYTEQRLGFALFDRIKGRLYPTPEARRLFTEVSSLYQSVQRVNEVAESLAENREGQLNIACSPSLGQSLLPAAVAKFCQRFPNVRIVLHTLIPNVLQQSLLTQRVELGVAYMPPEHPSIKTVSLFPNRLVAVLPIGHRLAGLRQIDVSDLKSEPLIGYSPEIPLAMLVRELFGESEEDQPVSRIEVQQAHVACAMVQAGAGVAVVDEMTVRGPIWTKVVSMPLIESIDAPIKLMHLELNSLSRLAKEFIHVLKSLKAYQ